MPYLYINIRSAVAAVTVAAALITSSCKKFIEIPPNPTTLAPSQIFADSANATAAITGIYISMIGTSSPALSIGNDGMGMWTGMAADEFDATGAGFAKEFVNNNISITNTFNGSGLWANAYKFIYQSNAVMEGVAASSGISAAMKNRLIGEAEFLRAYFHFALINVYSGVPLCIVSDYKVTSKLPRADTGAVYRQIVADLEDAYQRLQHDPLTLTKVRVNRYAVKALLARVYLYRKQWTLAEAAATEVIGGNYGLVTNLDSAFLVNNREAIWQVPSTAPGWETVVANNIIPQYGGNVPTSIVAPHLLNAFETGDKRRTQWIATTSTGLYTYPYKFKLVNNSAVTVSNPKEAHTPLRLGEMYLIRAEARLKQGIAGAAEDVNRIRNRAGLGNTTAASDDDIMKAIMQERRVELFGEWGHRFFDLKRTGTIDAVLGAEKTTWRSAAALFPIPYNETQLNPNLTPNP
ncbi:hypothetical protein HNQ91_001747 [Filimonas zeae]|uniref:Membrane protein n=1 Tax=Filimonas zeae TaxID=1737353 RepID=A0A917IYS6_9BACT|nr:RagB/SusD family nutrient uptake outer membrane protein [Filimonas zeae]MDR6338696.1 hypothetical protein [Filimonas zeae]GGH67011.1 membrane protein [Filimonas zeae]